MTSNPVPTIKKAIPHQRDLPGNALRIKVVIPEDISDHPAVFLIDITLLPEKIYFVCCYQ